MQAKHVFDITRTVSMMITVVGQLPAQGPEGQKVLNIDRTHPLTPNTTTRQLRMHLDCIEWTFVIFF